MDSIDTNNIPHHYDARGYIEEWKIRSMAIGITPTINDWGAKAVSEDSMMVELTKRMDQLELENNLLRLKLLGIEGKFSQEEMANIRKMLISEDEASVNLAQTIIQNA